MKKEALARIWEREIVPVWSEPFGRGLLEKLEIPPKAQVLDLGCGTGYPLMALLERMDESSRIIGIDTAPAMIDIARRRAGALAGKRVFLKVEDIEHLTFADEVFDLAVANLVLHDTDDPRRVLSEVFRVLRPGSGVLGVTRPLAGTFVEFYDLLREAIEVSGSPGVLERLDEHMTMFPDATAARQELEAAGFEDVEVEVRRFSLLFRSSREFFFAPVIEHGFLRRWKALFPDKAATQRAFLWAKKAIDRYHGSGPFSLTVEAGLVTGRRPAVALVTGPGA